MITKINAITRFILSHRYDLFKISIKTLTPNWSRRTPTASTKFPEGALQ